MRTVWTEADYENMSWHDCHVHGFEILEGIHGEGELTLDIDYITEWRSGANGKYQFVIAPARLTFKGVSQLQMELDYKTPTAGLVPFSISNISRTEVTRHPGHATSEWNIGINWPEGRIYFEAHGFIQESYGPSVETDQQMLSVVQRGGNANDA